jgi:hypothetical protein
MNNRNQNQTNRQQAVSSDGRAVRASVDINILCHLISAGAIEPAICAHVTDGFLSTIFQLPVMACQIINPCGLQYFNSDCRDLSSYQQWMSPSAGTALGRGTMLGVKGPRPLWRT